MAVAMTELICADTVSGTDDESNVRYLFCTSQKNGADAKGFETEEGFIVLQGAKVSRYLAPSFSHSRPFSYYELRMRLERDGTIRDGVLQFDHKFRSASEASAVILGRSSNGYDDWRTENGTKLGDI